MTMKLLVVQLSFIFVIQVCGRGYGGRKPKEVMPKPKQNGNFGLLGLQGGSVKKDPAWIKQLLGSTVDGLPKIGGQGGFARHGGAGVGENFAHGLREGWGASLSTSSQESVSSWTDPLQGRQFPGDFTGGGLVLDPSTGHYIHKAAKSTGQVAGMIGSSAGHKIAKKSQTDIGQGVINQAGHLALQTTGGFGSIDFGGGMHQRMKQETHMDRKGMAGVGSIGIGRGTHQIMKQETHMDRKVMAGVGSIGIGGGTHQRMKQETHMDRKGMAGVGSIGIGGGTHQRMKQQTHMDRKSMGGVGSIGIGGGTHQIMKQQTHMNRKSMGGVGSIGSGRGTLQIMKQETHMDRKGMGGVSSIGIGGGTHQMIKQETHIDRKNMGGGGIFGIGGGVQHNMVKQSGNGGVVPHDVIKQTEQIGGVGTFGHMAVKSGVGMGGDPISHNIRKSGGSSGVIEADHIMAKTSTTHESVKFQNGMGQMNNLGANLNSGLHIAAKIDPFGVGAAAGNFEHNTIKATDGSGIAGGSHQIMKQVNHMDSKNMNGVGSRGIGGGTLQKIQQENHIDRKNLGEGGVFGIGGGTHQMIKQENHIDRKNMGGGGIFGVSGGTHQMVQQENHMDRKNLGGGGVFGIGGGTHQMIKQENHIDRKNMGGGGVSGIRGGAQHNMMKQSGHGGVVSRTIIKQTEQISGFTPGSGFDGSVGNMNLGGVVPFRGTNPVHDVNKVVNSGFASMNHDPLASSIGSQMAQRTIHQSVKTVNMGSNGGVSMGDPFASAAASGLARESVHVAGKTLGMASSGGGVIGGGHFGGRMGPTLPKLPRMPKTGGYGGRQRKPVVKAW